MISFAFISCLSLSHVTSSPICPAEQTVRVRAPGAVTGTPASRLARQLACDVNTRWHDYVLPGDFLETLPLLPLQTLKHVKQANQPLLVGCQSRCDAAGS